MNQSAPDPDMIENDQDEQDEQEEVASAEMAADASDHADILRVQVGEREIILVGTAHISATSVEVVRDVIAAEMPDAVCIELDEQRYRALTNEQDWKSLDLKEVIRKKQTTFLVARLALSAFQKRMSSYTGVKPGSEMLAAIEAAEEIGADIVLADRDIKITLLRSWRKTGFFKRMSVASMLLAGMFEKSQVDEQALEELREEANIQSMLAEMEDFLPSVKKVIVDERDLYMADQILNSTGQKVVVIIGAAHREGIARHLLTPPSAETLEEITTVPPKATISKFIPWILPALILGLFVAGFFFGDRSRISEVAIYWLAINGALAGLGVLITGGHIITIIATALAAPFTSVNPTIGAGMVAGLVQTIVASPTVEDMESVGEAIAEWKGWWKNRLTRILIVALGGSLGSTLGTIIGFRWLASLF